jgi:hypothetical protein
VVGVGHRHGTAEQPQRPGPLRVQMLVALPEHPVAGPEQEGGEQVQHPAEARDEHRAAGDEQPAEDQGAQDAEEQDAVLYSRGTAKELRRTAQTKTLSTERDFSIR